MDSRVPSKDMDDCREGGVRVRRDETTSPTPPPKVSSAPSKESDICSYFHCPKLRRSSLRVGYCLPLVTYYGFYFVYSESVIFPRRDTGNYSSDLTQEDVVLLR